MSVVRHEGKQQITCDSCPASQHHAYDDADFDVMLDDAKAAGWRVFKRAGIWVHTCPSCTTAQSKGSLL
jgi:hypothetical protein